MLIDLRHIAKEQKQGHRRRWPWQKVDHQIWHRSHMTYNDRPEGYVALWGNRALGTGGKTPYHCLIKTSGLIWWLVPWNRIAPGAAPKNSVSYNIAIERDMRHLPPTRAQWESAKWLAAMLYRDHKVTNIVGHTEFIPSRWGKVCPGRFLDIDTLRQEAEKEKI